GGNNGSNLLGNPTKVFTSATPLAVILSTSGDSSWETIDRAGYAANCGVAATIHDVACWGSNSYGQLGIGSFSSVTSLPRPIAAAVRLHGVSAGDVWACALDDGNAAYCWGKSINGAPSVVTTPINCGSATLPYDCLPTPQKLKTPIRFASLTAGQRHFC